MTTTDEWGPTAAGFVRPTYDEALNVVKTDLKKLYGSDIDLSSNSFIGQQAQVIARMYINTYTEGERIYNSHFVQTATGAALDKLAENKQTTRNPATYASGSVIFARASAAPQRYDIPAGTTVATADRTLTYVTTEEGYIDIGSTASAEIPISASEVGVIYNITPGTISAITTPVIGIDTVTNSAAITGGSDMETDAVFRARVMSYRADTRGTMEAIQAALLEIDGVIGLSVVEDTGNNLVYVYITGGADTEIADVIDTVRPAGISVLWSRPTQVSISVSATTTGAGASVESALTSYLDTLAIGDNVTYSALVAAAMSAAAGAAITALTATNGVSTIYTLGDVIATPAGSKAITGTITITEET